MTTALRNFEGSVVVISHDRMFLEDLEPTHILTVRGGRAFFEERGLRDDDWNDDLFSRVESHESNLADATTEKSKSSSPIQSSADTKSNGKSSKNKNNIANSNPKSAFSSTSGHNSGSAATSVPLSTDASPKTASGKDHKKLTKIESSITKFEKEISAIDAEMTQVPFL